MCNLPDGFECQHSNRLTLFAVQELFLLQHTKVEAHILTVHRIAKRATLVYGTTAGHREVPESWR